MLVCSRTYPRKKHKVNTSNDIELSLYCFSYRFPSPRATLFFLTSFYLRDISASSEVSCSAVRDSHEAPMRCCCNDTAHFSNFWRLEHFRWHSHRNEYASLYIYSHENTVLVVAVESADSMHHVQLTSIRENSAENFFSTILTFYDNPSEFTPKRLFIIKQ